MGFDLQRLFVGMILQSRDFFKPFNVSYDGRAMIIDGERRMLISGGIHYPRATPELKCFWNGHEPVRGQYVYEGRYNLVK